MKLFVAFFALFGLVLAPTALAQYGSVDLSSSVDTATKTETSNDGVDTISVDATSNSGGGENGDITAGDTDGDEGATSSDADSSSWIRIQQTWPSGTGADPSFDSQPTSPGTDLNPQPDPPSADLNPQPDPPSAEASQYNESDFDFVTRLIETGGVNIAVGDVDAAEGDPDQPLVTGRTYNEVRVDGVKVRGWDPVSKGELDSREIGIREVDTEVELALLVAKAASADRNMEQITLNFAKVEFDYILPLKLFGFINTEMHSEVIIAFEEGDPAGADGLGRVKVQFPWWHVFGRKTVRPSDIITAYNEEAAKGDEAQSDTFTWIARNARTVAAFYSAMNKTYIPGLITTTVVN